MKCPLCNVHVSATDALNRRSMIERLVRELSDRFDRLERDKVERIVVAMQDADPALAMGVAELMLASKDLFELITSIQPAGGPN